MNPFVLDVLINMAVIPVLLLQVRLLVPDHNHPMITNEIVNFCLILAKIVTRAPCKDDPEIGASLVSTHPLQRNLTWIIYTGHIGNCRIQEVRIFGLLVKFLRQVQSRTSSCLERHKSWIKLKGLCPFFRLPAHDFNDELEVTVRTNRFRVK